jgi:hypothetical protein
MSKKLDAYILSADVIISISVNTAEQTVESKAKEEISEKVSVHAEYNISDIKEKTERKEGIIDKFDIIFKVTNSYTVENEEEARRLMKQEYRNKHSLRLNEDSIQLEDIESGVDTI